MTMMHKSKLLAIRVATIIGVMTLAGCGGSGPSVDEAYRVGYDIGLADECGREGERRGEQMPSAYDDSLSDGELASAFQTGYWAARNQSQPCKYR